MYRNRGLLTLSSPLYDIRDAEKVLDGNACLSCLTLSLGVIGWTALGRGQVGVCRGGYGGGCQEAKKPGQA